METPLEPRSRPPCFFNCCQLVPVCRASLVLQSRSSQTGAACESMPLCDAHGWRWEPGQGPSPCVGETVSLFLACGVLLYTIPLTKDVLHPFQRAAAAGSMAARIHAVQVSLAIVQALIALTGGMLSARPRGLLCGALVLHSLAWPAAWFTSATAMQRSPDCSKGLLWFWCCALVLNRWAASSRTNRLCRHDVESCESPRVGSKPPKFNSSRKMSHRCSEIYFKLCSVLCPSTYVSASSRCINVCVDAPLTLYYICVCATDRWR